MRNISAKSRREKSHVFYILYSVTFFPLKSCRLWENLEKCCRAGQSTDDNMAHAHYMLDT